MKSALFVQANVAVNSKLTSKVPFLFGNFQVFKKNLVKNVQFRYGTTGTPPPRRQHLREKFFSSPFRNPKVPLEAGAPPIFYASYAPDHISPRCLKITYTNTSTMTNQLVGFVLFTCAKILIRKIYWSTSE